MRHFIGNFREKALQIAAHLGVDTGTGSNGWIDRCRRGHNIDSWTLTGETGDSGTVGDSDIWLLQEVKELVCSDETGLFFSLKPSKSLTFVETPAMLEQ
jgi:hypothetical protein